MKNNELFEHWMTYVGWALFSISTLIAVQILFPWGYPISAVLIVFLPIRLLMMHWLNADNLWHRSLFVYLWVPPLLIIIYTGFIQLICTHRIFLFGSEQFWNKQLCTFDRMSNLLQIIGIYYVISFVLLLLFVTNKPKPSIVSKVEEWRISLYAIDWVAFICGFSTIFAFCMMALTLRFPHAFLGIGMMVGMLIPFLLKPFVNSFFSHVGLFGAVSITTTLLLLPVKEGLCWLLLYAPFLSALFYLETISDDFPIYSLILTMGGMLLVSGGLIIMADSILGRYKNPSL